MHTRRFEWETLAQLLVGGCAAVFGICVLIEHPQAQLSVPTGPIPAPPTQSPTFNPSNPGTVSQPSYQSLTPSTPTARSEQTSERVRSTATTTTEATTQARDPHWGLLIAATVGVFVFLLRMPITGHMAGIAIDAPNALGPHWR